jgi:hypothetical protein
MLRTIRLALSLMHPDRHHFPLADLPGLVIYAGVGKKDEVFRWLQRAYDELSYILAVYLNTDSRLDSLRSDPRFDELRRSIGLPAPH